MLPLQTRLHVEAVAPRGKSHGVTRVSQVVRHEEPALIVVEKPMQTIVVILVKPRAAVRIRTVIDRPVQRVQVRCLLAAKPVALVGFHVARPNSLM